ncbi:MAG: hypothetical protein MI807_16570 [Verrucomicrobiales bacterium]|nr:hypothetical protein [Verrucomicrobiales bacterium]
MSVEEKTPGPFRWFLGKLVKAPSAWLGLATAAFVGYSAMNAVNPVPTGGAIALGMMTGLAVAALSFLVMAGISASHHKAVEEKTSGSSRPSEIALLDELSRAGLSDDAELLGKMLNERNAIIRRSDKGPENPDWAHTRKLVEEIVEQSVARVEELQDVARRIADPLLSVPEGGEKEAQKIRDQWLTAYRAIVDAGSRLRKGNSLNEVDFLSEAGRAEGERSLAELTVQLQEETHIAERVHDRIVSGAGEKPEVPKSRIVLDEEEAEKENREKELE